MQITKIVRYSLIISCLNFIFAMIIAGIVFIARVFNWQIQNWQWYDYWIFGSVLAPIFIIVLYLSSVPEQKLYNYLQNKLINITEDQLKAHRLRVLELEKELIEIQKIDP